MEMNSKNKELGLLTPRRRITIMLVFLLLELSNGDSKKKSYRNEFTIKLIRKNQRF